MTEDGVAGVLRGRKLGHFELVETIGVGGMAAVIRARDTQLDRNVALKILPPEMARDPENVRRFHQEARAAAKLDHENIARVFFCGEDQGLHFIAFEFVEGENLRVLLERRGRIPVAEALRYMLQVATGLAHAAERGVVHRDIKPSNIIISPNGRAKIVDMGLARSLEPHIDGNLTQSGVTLGTFDYISPEQALEPREADVRSDIYSLGCTFYHMLTGTPPVPEGTAAKKLHHHQHIDPADPRQLNPEIPDELAALLARMMAKDPKARYQRPEELVQHLAVLARKLGAITEIPDTIVFAHPPLPTPSRVRPMAMTVAAVLGLIALVAVLGPNTGPSTISPPNSQAQHPQQGALDTSKDLKTVPLAASGPEQNEPVPSANKPDTPTWRAGDAKSLAEFLKDNAVGRVYLTKDIELTHADQLRFQGENLIIESVESDPAKMPTIRLRYVPDQSRAPCAALTVQSGTVRIKQVRFEIDAHDAPEIEMSAIAIEGGRLDIEKCEFDDKDLQGPFQGRLSSIRAKYTWAGIPSLFVTESYFGPSQHALSLTGPATVRAKQCAFAPQRVSVVDLDRAENPIAEPAAVTMVRCSAHVASGSVFRVNEGAACRLNVENCIISGPIEELPDQGGPALVQQSDNVNFHYTGSGNRYYRLKYLLMSSPGREPWQRAGSFSEFRRSFGVDDDATTSVELKESPWESPAPLQALQENKLSLAFRVDPRNPLLRQKDTVIGVDTCVWGKSSYDKLPPLPETKPQDIAGKFERIVDPSIQEAANNTYRSLRQALEDIPPGTVILIKQDGLMKVEPVRLEKAGTDVTIRPYRNFHPILTIGQTTDSDAALFRVYDGQLRLEQLEFHLKPVRSEFRAQTIVAVMGDGGCTFKDCVATLEEGREVPLSVVTLADPTGIMKMGPLTVPQQIPNIRLENCRARGSGSLVRVIASRPFTLNVEDSLVTLEGSFLIVDGNPKDLGSRGAHVEISLKRVITYLTEHLIWLRAFKEEGRNTKGLVHIQMKPVANCLFVSANGKSLVHCDGFDSEEQVKRCLSWGESDHNWYSGFSQYLDQQPSTENAAITPTPYSRTQWEDFTQEQNGRFDKVRFSILLPSEIPLAKVSAMDFKTKEVNVQGYGVDVERLPKATDDRSPGVVTPEN
ncbi:MAG TPA: protein kinase [Gemmataceae bacterium]|nr:protein kinase [Gemmataceae bacterium]